MSRSLRAHLLLVAVAALWGATFVLVKDALTGITPLLFNLLRMAVAFACMAALYHRHLARLTPRALWSGATVGFFLAAGYQFQTAGLARTTPSKSAFITGLVVVLVPLLAAIPTLRSRGAPAPGRKSILTAASAAVLAFAGILLLTLPRNAANALTPSASALHGINPGDLITGACALAFAFHCISISRVSARLPFEQLALLQIGFSTLFMAASTPLLEHPSLHLSTRLIVTLAITGILGTAAAFSIQTWAQQFLPAPHTVLILSLEPVFAALTSYIFLGERLGLRAAFGAVLVLAGIALTGLMPEPLQQASSHEGTAAPIPRPPRPL